MDDRLYTYDYRRPRPNNPTYLSGGVTDSLSIFPEKPIIQQDIYTKHQFQNQKSPLKTNKKEQRGYEPSNTHLFNRETNPRIQILQQYQNQLLQKGGEYQRQKSISPQNHPTNSQINSIPRGNQNNSKLSFYGSHLLTDDIIKNMKNQDSGNINDKDIHEKQDKRYNIITNKPKVIKQDMNKYNKNVSQDLQNYNTRLGESIKMQEKKIRIGEYDDWGGSIWNSKIIKSYGNNSNGMTEVMKMNSK